MENSNVSFLLPSVECSIDTQKTATLRDVGLLNDIELIFMLNSKNVFHVIDANAEAFLNNRLPELSLSHRVDRARNSFHFN